MPVYVIKWYITAACTQIFPVKIEAKKYYRKWSFYPTNCTRSTTICKYPINTTLHYHKTLQTIQKIHRINQQTCTPSLHLNKWRLHSNLSRTKMSLKTLIGRPHHTNSTNEHHRTPTKKKEPTNRRRKKKQITDPGIKENIVYRSVRDVYRDNRRQRRIRRHWKTDAHNTHHRALCTGSERDEQDNDRKARQISPSWERERRSKWVQYTRGGDIEIRMGGGWGGSVIRRWALHRVDWEIERKWRLGKCFEMHAYAQYMA